MVAFTYTGFLLMSAQPLILFLTRHLFLVQLPVLFSLYKTPISKVIPNHPGISCYFYDDDDDEQ